MQEFIPSAHQTAVQTALFKTTGDLQVSAVAGSGKSRTIEWLTTLLPEHVRSKTLLTAFNSHIAAELAVRQRAGRIPIGVAISTIHALGRRALQRHFRPRDPENWIEKEKTRRIVEALWAGRRDIAAHELDDAEAREGVKALGQLARMAMLSMTEPDDAERLHDLIAHFAIEVPMKHEEFILSNVAAVLRAHREGLPRPDKHGLTYLPSERISFDDMIYLPVALKVATEHYKLAFVDEVQDFNTLQQTLLMRAADRRVWVGDPCQAIYSFTGADAQAFDNIRVATNATQLPLSICYRCSKAVVAEARKIVSHIEAAEDAVDGAIVHETEERLIERVRAGYKADPSAPFMLLCRTNAPLVSTAFALIAEGVPARVLGRDIGATLGKTLDAITQIEGYEWDRFSKAAVDYRAVQYRALSGKPHAEMQIAAMDDRIDSVLAVHTAVVRAGGASIADVKAHVEALFADKPAVITLSSIHKAKGLECDRVGILHAELLPHPMARQAWEVEQERNLAYVAITRARRELYVVGDLALLAGAQVAPVATRPAEPAPAIVEPVAVRESQVGKRVVTIDLDVMPQRVAVTMPAGVRERVDALIAENYANGAVLRHLRDRLCEVYGLPE